MKLRRAWGISDDAFCVLFCGKMIPKKRPMDLVHAARVLRSSRKGKNLHLLFAGSGVLENVLRTSCTVLFDAESGCLRAAPQSISVDTKPYASFVGFLNQTEISSAYVAADCLVLASDFGETWGLVVNEALASGLPCVVSRACGCAEDLITEDQTFPVGDVAALSDRIARMLSRNMRSVPIPLPSVSDTISAVRHAYNDAVLGPR
jgi:glycosyltransferase involved in cell wall biosynthesis